MSSAQKHRSKRARGDGGYRRRGKDTWELKFSAIDPKSGARCPRYVTFKGTETAARTKLRELVKQADDGAWIAQKKQTYGQVLDAWDASLNVSPKTAERYRELVARFIRPHLGELQVQSLRPSRIEGFYSDLRDGRGPKGRMDGSRLAPRTIGHIHRLVVQSLSMAERDGAIPSNPARIAKRPKIERTELEILDEQQVRDVLTKLKGRSLYRVAALGLATGMRRGELCALRWKDVELDAALLRVEQSLEQTRTAGLRFKGPKTRYGKRAIALPASIVTELRAHRREQQEERLKLGLGRDPDEALVFRHLDPKTGAFSPLSPEAVTKQWRRLVTLLGLPNVSLHAWRHTHASQLIDSGMDVLTISRRLGHATPSITLDVYGHRFNRKDEEAAAVFEAAFSRVFSGTKADETGTDSK